MECCELFCNGDPAGKITLEPAGSRVEICSSMPAPGDGLYRVVLIGERGEMPLGVMEPDGAALKLRRRPYRRDVASLGKILRGEARRSFTFAAARSWRRTERPAELFESRWLREGLKNCGPALWRREQGMLRLALSYDPKAAFPLEKLFCLARVERIDGKRWVVYTFDREEQPVCREIT